MLRRVTNAESIEKYTRFLLLILYIVLAPIFAVFMLYFFRYGTAINLFSILAAFLVVLMFYFYSLIVNLFAGKVSRVVAVLFGMIFGTLTIWSGPTIGGWEEDLRFARQRPEFDEMVRQERARDLTNKAIRMVVKIEDKTILGINNSFFYIVYDETGEASRGLDSVHGYWRYPKSETGVINVGGLKTVKHITDHYYKFWTTD